MRRFIGKSLVALAFGLFLSAATADAAPITGGIGFGGSTSPVADWSTVSSIDIIGDTAVVLCSPVAPCTGAFAVFNLPIFQSAVYHDLPNFTGPVANLWTFGGFSFNLTGYTNITRATNGIVLEGLGTLFGPAGFDPTPAAWSFSADETNTVFRFSSTTAANPTVPDGGSTLTLLGLGFAGLAAARRKWARLQ
jgi:VPDSG-CTERM motif